MLARDLQVMCHGGGQGGEILTYAAVEELEIARSEFVFDIAAGQDEVFQVIVINVLKPFVEACTPFGGE